MKTFTVYLVVFLISLILFLRSVFAYEDRSFIVVFVPIPEDSIIVGKSFTITFTSRASLVEASQLHCEGYHGAFFPYNAIEKYIYYFKAKGQCFKWKELS